MPEWIGELFWMLYLLGCGACFGFAFIRNKYEIFPKGTEERIHQSIKDAFFDGLTMISISASIRVDSDHKAQAWNFSSTETFYRNIRRLFQ